MYSLKNPKSVGVVNPSGANQMLRAKVSVEPEGSELDLMYLVFEDGTTTTIPPQSADD